MRTQWTTKGNRDSSYSCSCDRGLHRYLRNFGGGELNPPNHPLGTPLLHSAHADSGAPSSRTYLTQGQGHRSFTAVWRSGSGISASFNCLQGVVPSSERSFLKQMVF